MGSCKQDYIADYSFCLSNFYANNINEESYDFIHANIRSMRQNFNLMMLELSQINKQIGVIALSETWIHSEEAELYNIEGYNSFHCCNDEYRAGGVSCYVSNKYTVTKLNINLVTADTLFLKINFGCTFLNLICVYRLHSHTVLEFIEEMASKLSHVANYSILMGDINLDLGSESQSTNNYLTMLSSFGFTQLVDKPTRITTQSRSCLDHIFVRHRNMALFRSVIFDINLTDHCLLGLKIINNKNNNGITIREREPTESALKTILDYALLKKS